MSTEATLPDRPTGTSTIHTERSGVVIGGASGIGRAIAQHVSATSEDVLLVDNEPSIVGVAEELGCRALVLDITDDDAPSRVTSTFEERRDAPDFIVNCAGIQRRGTLMDLGEQDWLALFDTNFHGLRRITSSLVRSIQATSTRATIVNVTSSSVAAVTPGIIAYSTAKAALTQWTRGLAAELGPDGIRVNAVAPGYVATPMTSDVLEDPDFRARVLARTPLRQVAAPEDVVGPVSFLLSDDARFVTGAVLPVDGGYTLGSMAGFDAPTESDA